MHTCVQYPHAPRGLARPQRGDGKGAVGEMHARGDLLRVPLPTPGVPNKANASAKSSRCCSRRARASSAAWALTARGEPKRPHSSQTAPENGPREQSTSSARIAARERAIGTPAHSNDRYSAIDKRRAQLPRHRNAITHSGGVILRLHRQSVHSDHNGVAGILQSPLPRCAHSRALSHT